MINKNDIVALITARKNSQSIKNKNMAKLSGKPLIWYSIDACAKSELITKTILSTDSDEIIKYSKKHNVNVYFKRPAKYSTNTATDLSVFLHFINFLKINGSHIPKYFIHIRPTCPIRNPKVIDEAIKLFIKSDHATSLRSVSLANENPYKMWHVNKKNELIPVLKNNKYHSMPRQKIPKSYWQNGYIDIISTKCIFKNSLTGNKILPFIIKETIYDIDYLSDINNLKEVMKKSNKEDREYPS